MVRQKTSLIIDENLWRDVKIHCIKEKKDISDWLEEIIKKELKQ